jgi:Protein of unknown function (DUF3572)
MKGSSEKLIKANELAVSALVFLAADADRLGRFLALTGLEPETIRLAAQEAGFLAGVLDHIAGDENLLLAFAGENGIRPEDVSRARNLLAGPVEG